MTWDPGRFRWRKMYRGKVYTVSCRELRVHPSKEASYQAANSWWQAKLVEIGEPPPHPHAEYLITLSRRLAWAQAHGKRDLARELRDRIEAVSSDTAGKPNGKPIPFDAASVVLELLDNAVWGERLSIAEEAPTPQDQRATRPETFTLVQPSLDMVPDGRRSDPPIYDWSEVAAPPLGPVHPTPWPSHPGHLSLT